MRNKIRAQAAGGAAAAAATGGWTGEGSSGKTGSAASREASWDYAAAQRDELQVMQAVYLVGGPGTIATQRAPCQG